MRRFILSILLVVFCIAISDARFAGDDADMLQKSQSFMGQFDQFSGLLNLTDQQQETLKQHSLVHRAKSKDLVKNIVEGRIKMSQIINADQIDEEKLNGILNGLQILHAELIKHQVQGILAIRQVLSLEQYHNLQKLLKDFKSPQLLEDRFY